MKNSYPLILSLAADNFERAIPLVNHLSPRSNIDDFNIPRVYRAAFFKVVGNESRPRMEIDPEVIKYYERAFPGIYQSETVGCPVLPNLGNGSAFRKLWDWNVEIAEKIYSEKKNSAD